MADLRVHETHCCPIHGCKYRDKDCPVSLLTAAPEYPNNNGCEICEDSRETHEGCNAEIARLRAELAAAREHVAKAASAVQYAIDNASNATIVHVELRAAREHLRLAAPTSTAHTGEGGEHV